MEVTRSGGKSSGVDRPYGFVEYLDLPDTKEQYVLGQHKIGTTVVTVRRTRVSLILSI